MSTLRKTFIGDEGLRSGWGILIFVVLVIAFSFSTDWFYAHLLKSHLPADPSDPVTIIAGEFVRALAIVLATWGTVTLARQRIEQFGLPPHEAFGRKFWTGAAWGFVNVSLAMAVLYLCHVYSIAGVALSGTAILKYAALWAVACVFIGLFEETAFRGYLLFALTRPMGFWPVAILLSFLFAFVHRSNPGETFIGLVGVFVIAMFICLTVIKTGSLWFAIGFHMVFDWCESFLYSVPDSGTPAVGHLLNTQISGSKWLSGGTAGPEASVVMLIVEVILFAIFLATHPEDKLPPWPRWRRADNPRLSVPPASEAA
jgi:membrane protease YdiL (CAAX protease family)